jgi:hypothetical protein
MISKLAKLLSCIDQPISEIQTANWRRRVLCNAFAFCFTVVLRSKILGWLAVHGLSEIILQSSGMGFFRRLDPNFRCERLNGRIKSCFDRQDRHRFSISRTEHTNDRPTGKHE